jgi:hypothetical protein
MQDPVLLIPGFQVRDEFVQDPERSLVIFSFIIFRILGSVIFIKLAPETARRKKKVLVGLILCPSYICTIPKILEPG